MDYSERGGRPGGCIFEGENKACGFDGFCPHKREDRTCMVEDSELLTREEYMSSKQPNKKVTGDYPIMLERLKARRIVLDASKNDKLELRWEKYGDYRQYDLSDLIGAWEAEAMELGTALKFYGPVEILNELVDVINQLEFIYDVLELWKC